MKRRDDTGPGAMRREEREEAGQLVLEGEALDAVEAILARYVKSAGARGAALVCRDGSVLAQAGDVEHVVRIAIASFETAALARRIFGREQIVRLFDDRWLAVEMSLVAEGTMLAALFGERTTLSMVRHYGRQAAAELQSRLAGHVSRVEG